MKSSKKTQPKKTDLPETKDDKKHLLPDEGILDLPDAEDIPGQEHVRPITGGEMADTTISSADEEGGELLNTDNDETFDDNTGNVTKEEEKLLEQSSLSTSLPDDQNLIRAKLDETDEEGALLNEKITPGGKDLDVPGSESDDENEEIGEEDEENNAYSQRQEKEDKNNAGQ